MAKHFYQFVPIFGIDIHVSVYQNSQTQMQAEKKLVEKYDLHDQEITPVSAMVLVRREGYICHLLFAEDDLTLGILTHEVAHLTHHILKHHCMNKREDKEIFSLLNEYLNSQIYHKLTKKGIKIAGS
jgi:hypothetical protein